MVLTEILGQDIAIKVYVATKKAPFAKAENKKLPFHPNETAIFYCGIYSSSFVCSSYAFSSLD